MLRRKYRQRKPGGNSVQRALRAGLPGWRENRGDLPGFVERELAAVVRCGQAEFGFTRLRCATCEDERLLPFSCKKRLCPSCAGRRMEDTSRSLVNRVLPAVPYRQWVLSLPPSIRRRVAFDRRACGEVITCFQKAVSRWYVRVAETEHGTTGVRAGVAAQAKAGSITVVQRFGDGLRLNPHLHVLFADGVFIPDPNGQRPKFRRVRRPRPAELEEIVASVAKRIQERIRGDADEGIDQPWLPGLVKRTRLSRFRKKRERRPRKKPLSCSVDGFDLHAGVRVRARDRAALRRLCRYLLRPAAPAARIEFLGDGTVLFELKRPWSDGTHTLEFTSESFAEHLAALVAPPRFNL
ncbi:MAG: hypothetical protein ACI9WU_000448, partial [Myxococcota bacterium]